MTRTTRSARSARLLLAGLAALALAAAPVAAANAAAAPLASCSYDLGTASLVCVEPGEDLNAAVLAEQHLVVIGPGAQRSSATPASPATGARATYVQTQLFDDAGYGGAVFQITNSGACNGSTVYQFGPLSSVGWAGRVSSFKSFAGCTTKIWSGPAYSGSSFGYQVNASSVGAMNDLANSVTIK
ncbi:hypothetical protein LLS1_13000 [Leifsonia sp. LS1]|uniref:hypothetical protein n=1 Tax=Leifsonia sp. LS1 TaxID=2828483 RepID=UPI001CFEC726|nr:hypothetical protein [Leifsonia sp. LS1]GIT79631.1 hypothetical protein LLS1_13000 [Leifsonia sp. LS1]